ncbi:AAA family ATPase [Mycobacterium avium]|uniref:AAA family ATPase n=1 Tax=Mycobacterium avium TaxID=1764 RepID=UPI00079FF468|nr:AAA family ATPase [Mycobacterium avium]MDV3215239.1 AAA family ATPase [Mycobacterium avium]
MKSSDEPGSRAAAGAAEANTNGHNGHPCGVDLPANFGKRRADPAATDDRVDVNGKRKGDEGFNPFNTRSANAKHAAASAAQQATDKRVKRWAARRYALAVLDGRTEPWARQIAADIGQRNAGRDPMKNAPEVMFSGDKAVNAGATDAQLAALPALTTDQLAALKIEASAELEATRLAVRERGRQITAARTAAGYADITTRVDLATYTPPADPFVVDGLIPLGKSLGLFSERKAGKTTANVDLVRALLTGGTFVGRFATRLPADADVAFLDTEMGADMMQYELSKAGVTDPALLRRINYHDLLGRSAMLNLSDDATRAYWRGQIRPGSFIIFDCLYTVLSALGIDESSSQVADVIEGFKTLAVECDAVGRVITHHLGKDPDKGARGHSSIEGAVDTLATIRLDGPAAADTPRTFEAFGRRGVNVPPGLLTLKPTDDGQHRLMMSGNTVSADQKTKRDHSDDDIVWKLIKDRPGTSVRALEALPAETRQVSKSRLRCAHARLAKLDYVINKGTDKRPEWHAANRNGDPFTDPAPVADGTD